MSYCKPNFPIILLLLLNLVISVHSYARQEKPTRWSVGVVFSPGFAYRSLVIPDSLGFLEDMRNEGDSPKFGYQAGASVIYRLSNSMELESGLLFSENGYKYSFSGFNSLNESDPAIPLEAVNKYSYKYLDVPLKANWFYSQKQVRLFLSAGIYAGIMLKESYISEARFADRTERRKLNHEWIDFNLPVFSFSLGTGIVYPVSDNLHLRLNPEFRHGITPMADTPAKQYNWLGLINTGIYFSL